MNAVEDKVFPPSPPYSDKADSDVSSLSSDGENGCLPLPPQSIEPKEILPVDLNSPDKHVARDPRLIRLTGNHPFNCEAPLSILFEAGKSFPGRI
jgi:nitrate reductase (NAD(P)H)